VHTSKGIQAAVLVVVHLVHSCHKLGGKPAGCSAAAQGFLQPLQSCIYDTTVQQSIAVTQIYGLSSDKGQADAYRDPLRQAQVVIFLLFSSPMQQGGHDMKITAYTVDLKCALCLPCWIGKIVETLMLGR